MTQFKTPLNIYILWHPHFKEGSTYAQEIYANFTRDVNEPLARGLGIPVFYGVKEISENSEASINYTSAHHTAIIILIESNMVADEEWHKYVDSIVIQCKVNSNCIIYPVACDKNAFAISDKINHINFIRLYDIQNVEDKKAYFIYMVAHELCRLLYNLKRTSEVAEIQMSPAPLTLFISHAKEDGLEMAKILNKYIQGNTPLKTFFDASDIATGYDFRQEIESHIQNSVLLVVHSDKYSSREWCRREIILGKKHNRPIIVVNVLTDGEDRSFPYMANVKTIRVHSPIKAEKIITCTLKETLRFKYQELYILYLSNKFGIQVDQNNVLSYPPELLSLLYLKDCDKAIVVYPDPPLSDEELEIVQTFKNDIVFATPSILPCISEERKFDDGNKLLNNVTVGISISENTDIEKYGFGYIHLQDAMVEVARYLLVCGATLAYGGDINYNHKFNFVDTLINLVKSHNKEHKDISQRINNYVPYPIHTTISSELKADLYSAAKFIEIPPIAESSSCSKDNALYEHYMYAKNLTNMREIMNDKINARIILGGKIQGYKGKFPGIVEETYIALRSNKPVYLIGAFGGAAKAIIQCLKGQIPDELTNVYQLSNPDYENLYHYYNSEALKEEIEPINYLDIVNFFNSRGLSGLNNGLSDEENEIVFMTSNIIEAITLILKGLTKIRSNQ